MFTANGESMRITKLDQSVMSNIILNEIFLVPESTRNLSSIQKL